MKAIDLFNKTVTRVNLAETYIPTYGYISVSCVLGNKLCSYILQYGDTLETAFRKTSLRVEATRKSRGTAKNVIINRNLKKW